MNNYNIRLGSLFFVFVSLYLIVLANLYVIQVKQSKYFSSLGKQQYNLTVCQMPPRAAIFDRFGQPLAINKDNFSAFITPNNLEEPKKVESFLNKYFPLAAHKLKKNNNLNFMYIKRRLNQEQLDLINSFQLSDIKLLKEPSRYYPVDCVGPLVGITDIDNQGLFGIELLCNSTLSGKPTTYVLEKDARTNQSKNFYFKRETKVQGKQGQAVQLTIDSTLQFLVYEELKETIKNLKAKEGSVLIINPDNGEILVMANCPDFDPNNTEQLAMESIKNRIFTECYELGSVVKIFLLLAALHEGVVTAQELIDCENSKTASINGFKFSTYKAGGIIPFCQVIEDSNNIGVAKVALRLGSKLYDNYLKLGFTNKIGLFPGENKGYITPPNKWSNSSIIVLSFGYEISANLMQLAQAMSIVANNGYLIKPRIIKDEQEEKLTKLEELRRKDRSENSDRRSPPESKQLFNTQAIEETKNILANTSKVKIPGCRVIGKTGTARLITNGKYDPNRHIFTYAGIIEKGNYKRIIITFIKETNPDGMASTTAMPLFEKVAHKMLIHDKII